MVLDPSSNIGKLKHKLTAKTTTDANENGSNKPLIQDTDASGKADDALLSQIQDEKVIAYASRNLTKY